MADPAHAAYGSGGLGAEGGHAQPGGFDSQYDRNLLVYWTLWYKLSHDHDTDVDASFEPLELFQDMCQDACAYRTPVPTEFWKFYGSYDESLAYGDDVQCRDIAPLVTYGSLRQLQHRTGGSTCDGLFDEDMVNHVYCNGDDTGRAPVSSGAFFGLDYASRAAHSAYNYKRETLCDATVDLSVEDAVGNPASQTETLYDSTGATGTLLNSLLVEPSKRGESRFDAEYLSRSLMVFVYVTSSHDPGTPPGVYRLADLKVFADLACASMPSVNCGQRVATVSTTVPDVGEYVQSLSTASSLARFAQAGFSPGPSASTRPWRSAGCTAWAVASASRRATTAARSRSTPTRSSSSPTTPRRTTSSPAGARCCRRAAPATSPTTCSPSFSGRQDSDGALRPQPARRQRRVQRRRPRHRQQPDQPAHGPLQLPPARAAAEPPPPPRTPPPEPPAPPPPPPPPEPPTLFSSSEIKAFVRDAEAEFCDSVRPLRVPTRPAHAAPSRRRSAHAGLLALEPDALRRAGGQAAAALPGEPVAARASPASVLGAEAAAASATSAPRLAERVLPPCHHARHAQHAVRARQRVGHEQPACARRQRPRQGDAPPEAAPRALHRDHDARRAGVGARADRLAARQQPRSLHGRHERRADAPRHWRAARQCVDGLRHCSNAPTYDERAYENSLEPRLVLDMDAPSFERQRYVWAVEIDLPSDHRGERLFRSPASGGGYGYRIRLLQATGVETNTSCLSMAEQQFTGWQTASPCSSTSARTPP